MRLRPTWAASSSRLKATGRSGGAAACARPGSRTSGKQVATIAPTAVAAPKRLAEQCAPAVTWLTSTQRWQRSGTGRPMGKGHQHLWQQVATAKQPGGVASVGTAGAPPCSIGYEDLGARNVPMRPAASSQVSPASALEHRTCWLSGTGRPTRHMAGVQTALLWAQDRRRTGSSMTIASWDWCTDGMQK